MVVLLSNECWVTAVDVQVAVGNRDDEDVVCQQAMLRSIAVGDDQVMREGRRRLEVSVVNGKHVPFIANELAPISQIIYKHARGFHY